MLRWTKTVLLAASLVSAATAAGCASDYDDDGAYGRDHYYHPRYRDSDDTYRDRNRDRDRRWVCDADGDDCRWER